MARHPLPLPHEADGLLAQLLGPAAERTESLADPPGLQDCPSCERPFVVPRATREVVDAEHVRVDLACTNCGWHATGVHGDTELAALDAQLDRHFADLLWTLELVWAANEEDAIERFACALDAGAILPEDFAA